MVDCNMVSQWTNGKYLFGYVIDVVVYYKEVSLLLFWDLAGGMGVSWSLDLELWCLDSLISPGGRDYLFFSWEEATYCFFLTMK